MKRAVTDWDRLRIPRRRVPARLALSDGAFRVGELYVDVLRSDGSAGRVADRLSDTRERYVPLAADGEHVLLNKDAIVSVQLTREEVDFPVADGVADHDVKIKLSTGHIVQGTFRAFAVPGYGRVLDYLNRTIDPFVPLLEPDGAVLLNVDFMVEVTEVPRHEKTGE